MKSLSDHLPLFEHDPKAPKHPLAASVNEILKFVGENKKYTYGYWLRLVSKSGKTYGEILSLIKSLEKMDKKYPRGAVLTNKLMDK